MEIISNFDKLNSVVPEGNAVFVKEDGYLRVTNRTEGYSSISVHADKLLGLKTAYKAVWCIKLPEGSKQIRLRAYNKLIIESLDMQEIVYCSSDEFIITDKEWVEISLANTVPEDSKLLDFICYFIESGGATTDILVKSLEIAETDPVKIGERKREILPVKRQDRAYIGTIRWDAFTESTPDGIIPASQVARVLSHKEYHNQAPFFSLVEGEKVSFPEYTMDIWEKEADYALQGGMDYFAYLWYETTDEMSQPRKMHLKSPNKDKILMCGILERIRKQETMKELYDAMHSSCYLRLDTRPVVFLYGLDRWSAEEIQTLCDGAEKEGITEPLYIVGMSIAKTPYPFNVNFTKGIDAVSWYSVNATEKDMPFEKLKNDCEEVIVNAGKLCKEKGIDLIPAFTTGRDTRARIRTGVSWCAGDPNASEDKNRPYGNRYALPPTDKELEEHIRFTIKYIEDNPDHTKPRMVCSYGWNEHEEGGWLCPTLKVDENNNVIRDENGNILPDTKRIDILRKVVDEIYGK